MSAFNLRKHAFGLLRIWHAVLAGGFLVAYLTADEDTYAMHLFAGYVVLAAIAIRLAAGLFAPPGNPFRLPRPTLRDVLAWLPRRRGRNPFFAWFAAVLLGIVGLAAASGAVADFLPRVEDLHEGVAEAALWVIFGHVAFVVAIYNGRRLTAWLSALLTSKSRPEAPR